jgi:thiol:disulfide interchange protein DsbA
MNQINKLFLCTVFVFAMGCGEQSSGQIDSPQEAPAPAATQAAEATQVAALSESPASDASGAANLKSVSYVEGTHYERLPKPVPTVDSSKIEVAEVFWYGCSHCYDFEPGFEAWSKTLGSDVVVVKSPAMWDNQGIMANHARIYYTAKVLGVLDVISPAAFRALNVDGKSLRSEDEIAQLFTANGVSPEDFERTFKSFGVTSSVRQAEARQRNYRVQGTPEVIVDGTYRISARMAGSHEAVLKVAEHLIDRIRREKTES